MAPTCEKNVQIKLTPKNFLLIIFNVVYIEVNEVMMLYATFNNISVISWQSVLLVEETGENLQQVTDKLYHIMLYTSHELSFKLTTSVVIGTDWIGSCKSNYHTITVT
jgi:hypothetical protein